MAAVRLMVFDRTCTRSPIGPGLSHAWAAGGHLYRWLGRVDAWTGAASWDEALAFLTSARAPARVDDVQIWAHGHPGGARMRDDVLDVGALSPGHRLHAGLLALRARLSGPEALVWFRTCETFAGDAGQRFARGLADLLGCRVAGHTRVIGVRQPGLYVVGPEQDGPWSHEGANVTFLHGRPPRRGTPA